MSCGLLRFEHGEVARYCPASVLQALLKLARRLNRVLRVEPVAVVGLDLAAIVEDLHRAVRTWGVCLDVFGIDPAQRTIAVPQLQESVVAASLDAYRH